MGFRLGLLSLAQPLKEICGRVQPSSTVGISLSLLSRYTYTELNVEVVHLVRLFRVATTGKAYDLQPPGILKAPSSSGIGILATWRFQAHPPVATLGFRRLCFRAGKTELPSSPQRSQSWKLVQPEPV